MRVLLGTNQLAKFSGSETVLFEMAQHFRDRGDELLLFANWLDNPMKRRLGEHNITATTDPAKVRPLSFDVVYLQHQIAPLFDYSPSPSDVKRTTFAFGRLSPTGFQESGGWATEAVLADIVLANSPETARALVAAGTTAPIQVFHNAAPERFFTVARRRLPSAPRRILIVSNHKTPELREAAAILGQAFEVEHVGRSGARVGSVNPKLISRADVVVTIGKTVQYALACGTPVFIYDRGKGPGYLTPDSFERAADLNFSGRCTPTARSGEELATAIVEDYPSGVAFAQATGVDLLSRFRLEPYLDALAGLATSNAKRRERLEAQSREVSRERQMAEYLRKLYRRREQLEGRVAAPGRA